LQKISQSVKYAALPDRIRFLSKRYNITEQDINNILQYDPTKGKYLEWLVRQVLKQRLRLPEDGERIKDTLTLFVQKSKFLDKKDINQYKTLGDIQEALDAISGQTSKRENVRIQRGKGQEVVLDQPPYQVVKITTLEAAATLCRNTQWCIKDPKYFNQYSPKEFFVILKDGKRYALYHTNSAQLKDVYDRGLDKNTQLELLPILLNLGQPPLGGDLSDISQEIQNAVPYEELVKIPSNAYYLAEQGDRSEQVISSIAKDAYSSYHYARDILKGQRFPAGEAVIAKNAAFSYHYATDILKKPFPAGEAIITQNAQFSYYYARFLKGRFPAGEAAIAQSTQDSYYYAIFVLQGQRFPAGEEAIAKDAYYSYYYARDVLQGPFPAGEATIAKNAEFSYCYAKYILKPFPGSEINESDNFWLKIKGFLATFK